MSSLHTLYINTKKAAHTRSTEVYRRLRVLGGLQGQKEEISKYHIANLLCEKILKHS